MVTMQPTREERRIVEKLNRRLHVDLGNPPYSWQWSEDLTLLMQNIHDPWNYVGNRETGIVELAPQYTERRICAPTVIDRWVICHHRTCDLASWERQFGRSMPWPENGKWMPCDDGDNYIALPFGAIPDQTYTDIVIRRVREHRDVSDADALASMVKRMDRHEKIAAEKRRNIVEDEVPKALYKPQNVVYSLGPDGRKQNEVTQ